MTKPTSRPALRLYTPTALAPNTTIDLDEAQIHYLFKVMRRSSGDVVGLFNGQSGELSATLEQTSKKAACAHLGAPVLPPLNATPMKPVHLYFAPLKRNPTELIVQKATEFGATRLCPVITQHTRSDQLRLDRLQAIAIEATEQCERLEPPIIAPPQSLGAVLEQWRDQDPITMPMLVAAEAGASTPMESVLRSLPLSPDNAATLSLMIGPEGGFSPWEFDIMRRDAPNWQLVGLGPRILKAETAAMAMLALSQALWGDGDARPEFRGPRVSKFA